MLVPGGSPAYIKSVLTECIPILSAEIEKYLHGDDDYESIVDHLKRCTELCKKSVRENDRLDRFGFNEEIKFFVHTDNEWKQVLFQHLRFKSGVVPDWEEQFDVRKNFYIQLGELFTTALSWHQKSPEPSEKPYSWDSPNAGLEISELVFLLCQKSELVKINKELGGSFSKFRKEFFWLFGLSDKRYDQNISDILNRKKDQHFIDWLAGLMPNTAPELSKKK